MLSVNNKKKFINQLFADTGCCQIDFPRVIANSEVLREIEREIERERERKRGRKKESEREKERESDRERDRGPKESVLLARIDD